MLRHWYLLSEEGEQDAQLNIVGLYFINSIPCIRYRGLCFKQIDVIYVKFEIMFPIILIHVPCMFYYFVK